MATVRRTRHQPAISAVMTIDELSAYLQISKSSLYKLAQDGRIPGQKVGKHWRFHKDAVDRWLAAFQSIDAASTAPSVGRRGGAA